MARVTMLAVVVLAIGACTATTDGPAAADAAIATETDWSDNCPVLERPPLQLGGHLVGDNPPPQDYSSVPPTSGWHTRAVPAPGTMHPELADPEIAAAIEAGIVVVATAPDVDTAGLAAVLDQFPDRVLATTYAEPMDAPVALLTWGAVARCETVAATDITTFVLTERVDAEGH